MATSDTEKECKYKEIKNGQCKRGWYMIVLISDEGTTSYLCPQTCPSANFPDK
jgi:hypothetical protein